MDIIDKIIESDRFQQDLHAASPPPKRRFDWRAAICLLAYCLACFGAGYVLCVRLADGGLY